MTFSVQSEVGQLRQAIVHRPGLELSRLTPQNIGELLFDDVLWASKAKEEHDVFAEILGPALVGPLRGLFADLDGPRLAEYLTGPGIREDVHPDPFGIRGCRARRGRPCHLPRPRRIPARPQATRPRSARCPMPSASWPAEPAPPSALFHDRGQKRANSARNCP